MSGAYFMAQESGFRNLVPRPREERRALSNKDLLEKQRLASRREGFSRYHYQENIVVPDATAAGFLSDADRFHTDTAGEEKREREAVNQRRSHMVETTRQMRVAREEDRWKKMEDMERDESQRWASLAGSSKNNISSVAYNVVTMQYHPSDEGQKLAKEEDVLRYRAAVRAQRLYEKTSSSVNPLTGEPLPQRVTVPHKPW
jgi:hypothetical protein